MLETVKFRIVLKFIAIILAVWQMDTAIDMEKPELAIYDEINQTMDIESQDNPLFRHSVKICHFCHSDFLNERVGLTSLDSKKILTFNIFLQFSSSKFQLAHTSQEYYHFRRSNSIWQYECFAAVLALLHYFIFGNIREMFFLNRTNCIFLISFLFVILASTFVILSRFGSPFSPFFDEAEVKWLRLYLGMSFSRVQLYEYLVFFFSVLSSNLSLLARVVEGCLPIYPQNGIWYFQQNCNPNAEVSTTIILH